MVSIFLCCFVAATHASDAFVLSHSCSLFAWNFHCTLIKFTHKTPHNLFVCLLLYNNANSIERWTVTMVRTLCIYLQWRWSLESSKRNHKYWMCVRVPLDSVLSMKFPFYIHICDIFCISSFFHKSIKRALQHIKIPFYFG